MYSISAHFKVVTPLFMGGANHLYDGIRVPSIKGVLRFWWRALNYSVYSGNIAKLKEAEGRLFGDTDQQSQLLLQVKNIESQKENIHSVGDLHPTLKGNGFNGARYLGYGAIEAFGSRNNGTRKGQLTRDCIDGCEFELLIRSKQPLENNILDTLKLFGLLGGLGTRSRKGFGSLTLLRIRGSDGNEMYKAPSTCSDYIEQLRQVLSVSTTYEQVPAISAFSKHTQLWVLGKGKNANTLLDDYGRRMQLYRSWGNTAQGNLVNGVESEKRFECDHHWSKRIHHPDVGRDFHPKRSVFGLPHNYGKGENLEVNPSQFERRASPLFHHIHACNDKSYISCALVLKSQFLPDNKGKEINAGGKAVPDNTDFDILCKFINAYELSANGEENRDRPYFQDKSPVFPPGE